MIITIVMTMMVMTKAKVERLRRGWSQQQLALFALIWPSDVSRIETGRTRPYPGQAKRLAKVLGLTPKELQDPVGIEGITSTHQKKGVRRR